MDKIYEVKSILKELELDNNQIEAAKETDNLELIGFDSIKIINFIVLLEEYYNITIEDEDLLFDKYHTLKDIVRVIEKYLVV